MTLPTQLSELEVFLNRFSPEEITAMVSREIIIAYNLDDIIAESNIGLERELSLLKKWVQIVDKVASQKKEEEEQFIYRKTVLFAKDIIQYELQKNRDSEGVLTLLVYHFEKYSTYYVRELFDELIKLPIETSYSPTFFASSEKERKYYLRFLPAILLLKSFTYHTNTWGEFTEIEKQFMEKFFKDRRYTQKFLAILHKDKLLQISFSQICKYQMWFKEIIHHSAYQNEMQM